MLMFLQLDLYFKESNYPENIDENDIIQHIENRKSIFKK